jgi:hypothetical protein
MANYDIGTATGATNEEIATAIKGVVGSGASATQISNILKGTLSSLEYGATVDDITSLLTDGNADKNKILFEGLPIDTGSEILLDGSYINHTVSITTEQPAPYGEVQLYYKTSHLSEALPIYEEDGITQVVIGLTNPQSVFIKEVFIYSLVLIPVSVSGLYNIQINNSKKLSNTTIENEGCDFLLPTLIDLSQENNNSTQVTIIGDGLNTGSISVYVQIHSGNHFETLFETDGTTPVEVSAKSSSVLTIKNQSINALRLVPSGLTKNYAYSVLTTRGII